MMMTRDNFFALDEDSLEYSDSEFKGVGKSFEVSMKNNSHLLI